MVAVKKLITLVSILTLSTSAFAGFQGNNGGGFQGKKAKSITTVAQAKKAYDDAPVSISGYIVKQLDEDSFIFRDSSGQIRIDVDDDAWGGLHVDSKTRIRIHGKVDRDDNRTEIDVKRISK
ncbi:YgiW/YdeI family stress tolerance OB fold protein [Glaesserella sp.]